MQKNNDGYQEAVIVKIGIFDSGIGGLSLLHQAMITLPEVDYVFYADGTGYPLYLFCSSFKNMTMEVYDY